MIEALEMVFFDFAKTICNVFEFFVCTHFLVAIINSVFINSPTPKFKNHHPTRTNRFFFVHALLLPVFLQLFSLFLHSISILSYFLSLFSFPFPLLPFIHSIFPYYFSNSIRGHWEHTPHYAEFLGDNSEQRQVLLFWR